MSQAGIVDIESSHPTIPTQFDTDVGTGAIAVGNVLNVLGGSGIETSSSGNTITIDLTGGGAAIDSLTTDVAGPVSPDGSGDVTVTGTSIFSDGTVANTLTLNVQATANTFLLGAGAGSTATEIGPLTNGQLIIGSTGLAPSAGSLASSDGSITISAGAGTIDLSVAAGDDAILTLTGDAGGAVSPTAGDIDIQGVTVANAANAKPLFAQGTPGSSLIEMDIQVGTAVTGAPGDKLDAGLSSYNDIFHTVDADGYVDLTTNWEATSMHAWNGSIVESAAITVTSDGATITLSVEKSGGGDLTVVFSDPDFYYTWDTTPADTVTLTPGTDTVPIQSFVYFLASTKTLTASTVGWPATEHAPIATVLCQSAATLQTDGAYKVHAWTDHVVATDVQGHVGDINYWIRQQPATWQSGVTQTYTITTNGGAADNVILTTTAGVVLQLHTHTFPAFAGTPDIYVVNDSVTPYTKVTDLNALLTDSTGVSMSGRYFSLVIWGCVSEDTGDCKLFVNLPGGSYNNSSGLLDDTDAYSNYTIPPSFRGTGFLISEWKLRHQVAASGTWTSIDEINLLGLFPSLAAGGTPGSIVFTTDSGVATPASNNINIFGGPGVTVSGATDTVTISSVVYTDQAGSVSVVSDSGSFSTAAVTLTLPAAPAQGERCEFIATTTDDLIITAAGTQVIHLGSVTSSAGGTCTSTDAGDAISLIYQSATDDWWALNAVGVWVIA